MTENTIEREIFIEAAIGHVWSLVSKAGFWIGDDVHFETEARPGELAIIDAGRHGHFPVRVERLEPPRYAAYRWLRGAAETVPGDGNSTLVEFTLAEQDGGTLLRLRESGFATLARPAAAREAEYQGNLEGWALMLGLLQRAATGVVAR